MSTTPEATVAPPITAQPTVADAPLRRSSVFWVVLISAIAIIFDGYDLVIYGTVVPTFLADPSHIGHVSPQVAGQLGSYALFGVLVGALGCGAVTDVIGRRKVMLLAIAWFSIGMAATAMSTTVTAFGALRFVTGIGVGALVATAGAIVAEFAPPNRRQLFNAIVYCGVPAGGFLASIAALLLASSIGWRGLFMIGAAPILFLLPLALWKLPESPLWLESRGRHAEALEWSRRTGVPLVQHVNPDSVKAPSSEPAGFAALFSRKYFVATIFLGLMSFSGLLLTYGLNTWLPVIMGNHGYDTKGSLLFLLTLNLGAMIGSMTASWVADRIGARSVIVALFALAAICLLVLPFSLPYGVLLLLVALAGMGTIGVQVLIYGFGSNFYESRARGAGVAWVAGFGRLGGIFGPLVGGFLVAAGIEITLAFQLFAVVALMGGLFTLVPRQPRSAQQEAAAVEVGAAQQGLVEEGITPATAS
ncbi:MFS transporter [Luteococcus sp. Sow4_B9]|uniref:MFS transporter n=1 Tax=Luteococcus sp. Sow4_B9 TaxID=3438792 RepID=UPI003F958442